MQLQTLYFYQNKENQPCFHLVLCDKGCNNTKCKKWQHVRSFPWQTWSIPRQEKKYPETILKNILLSASEFSQSSEPNLKLQGSIFYLHRSISISKEVSHYPQEVSRSLKKYLPFQKKTISEPFGMPYVPTGTDIKLIVLMLLIMLLKDVYCICLAVYSCTEFSSIQFAWYFWLQVPP